MIQKIKILKEEEAIWHKIMIKEINILFSSVGRRVELVKYFDRARKKLGIKSKLIGIDIEKTAPALNFVDKYYLVPRVTSENFIEKVL